MKNITLKIVEVEMDGKPVKLSYKAQIIELMRAPSGDKGADIEEIRRSIKILDALDTCKGDVLKLEDADFEFMKSKILHARWPFIDKYIQAFVDDVTS